MDRLTATAVALTFAGVTALTACTDANSDAANPTGSPTSPVTSGSTSSTPTPTPTSVSPTDRETAAAQAIVLRFLALHDTLATDPASRLDRLATVSRGQALDQMRTTLFRQRLKGWRQIGLATVVTTSAKQDSARRYDVSACIDVTKVNLVDRKGESVVTADRLPRTR